MDVHAAIADVWSGPAQRVAVAAAEDPAVLHTAVRAAQLGIAQPLLFGSEAEIRAVAAEQGLNLCACRIVHAAGAQASAQAAVAAVRSGEAGMLMKGHLPTATFLRAVLHKEQGLHPKTLLSHVSILRLGAQGRTLLLTDAAMVPYPDLKAKLALVRHAVQVAGRLGMDMPRVAALAAVELVNPDMPATLDAAALTQMNRRGQLEGCVVDGPLAMDLALSAEAARHKGVNSPVSGQADILLFHNIEAANSVVKTFTAMTDCLFGGVVMGAGVPIVLPSRSDCIDNKLFSIACAAAVCEPRGDAGTPAPA